MKHSWSFANIHVKTKERNKAMKKTYQNPTVKIVNVELSSMVAATLNINQNGSALTSEDNVAARRGGSFWDDDEE